jgi:hypothetical protein
VFPTSQARIFDAAMSNFSVQEMQAVLDAYDLTADGTLADIGGGVGSKLAGGLERTEAEYRRLFAAHGFRVTPAVPTVTDISVVEGVPA